MDLIKQDIPSLLGKLAGEVSNLAREEISLAKLELRQNAKEAAADAAAVTAGASVVYAGLLFLLLGAVAGLATVMPLWGASLIVGAVVTLCGALVMKTGAERASKNVPDFEHTSQSLSDNKTFIKERLTA